MLVVYCVTVEAGISGVSGGLLVVVGGSGGAGAPPGDPPPELGFFLVVNVYTFLVVCSPSVALTYQVYSVWYSRLLMVSVLVPGVWAVWLVLPMCGCVSMVYVRGLLFWSPNVIVRVLWLVGMLVA